MKLPVPEEEIVPFGSKPYLRLVQEDAYFLAVMRYIEPNPVRAGMVEWPGQYRWSSFCHNAGVKEIRFLRFHALYERLGDTPEERQQAYCALFNGHMEETGIKQIREA